MKVTKYPRVPLDKKAVDKIFEEATEQSEYILKLYTLVYPDFEKRETVPWPIISRLTGEYIMNKAVEWDTNHGLPARGVLAGGGWFNRGFSCAPRERTDLPDWVAEIPAE